VCTIVLTVTLSKKKNRASRGFLTPSKKKELRFARYFGWTVYQKIENDLEKTQPNKCG